MVAHLRLRADGIALHLELGICLHLVEQEKEKKLEF